MVDFNLYNALIIIAIIILVIIVVAVGFYFINKMINPEVIVSGDGEQKVLCIGDSITFGQGVLMNREKESYGKSDITAFTHGKSKLYQDVKKKIFYILTPFLWSLILSLKILNCQRN